MALYRTVSDRGIWKKYKQNENPKPQHFHKPCYIDREKPFITYPQLNIGDGYRYHYKQFVPEMRPDIDEVIKRFDGKESRKIIRSFKSCPSTPTTLLSRFSLFSGTDNNDSNYLTRGYKSSAQYQRSDARLQPDRGTSKCRYIRKHVENIDKRQNDAVISFKGVDIYRETNHYGYIDTTENTRQCYPDVERYSMESNSLTGFRNHSEQDSISDNNYCCPYARESVLHPDPLHLPNSIERENHFKAEEGLNLEEENVVSMFLQKASFLKGMNDNLVEENKDFKKQDNSNTKTVSPSTTFDNSDPFEFGAPNDTSRPIRQSSSRLVMVELKNNLLSKLTKPKHIQPEMPSPDKYLLSENQWKSSADKKQDKPKHTFKNSAEHLPDVKREILIKETLNLDEIQDDTKTNLTSKVEPTFKQHRTKPSKISDTVWKDNIPKINYAEVNQLGKESESTPSEDKVSDNIMVDINCLLGLTRLYFDSKYGLAPPIKMEEPHQKQHIRGPSPRHSPPNVDSDTKEVFQDRSTFEKSISSQVEKLLKQTTESEYAFDVKTMSYNIGVGKKEFNLQTFLKDNGNKKGKEEEGKHIIPEKRNFEDTALKIFRETSQEKKKSNPKQINKRFLNFSESQ